MKTCERCQGVGRIKAEPPIPVKGPHAAITEHLCPRCRGRGKQYTEADYNRDKQHRERTGQGL